MHRTISAMTIPDHFRYVDVVLAHLLQFFPGLPALSDFFAGKNISIYVHGS
jgi:hypothetical protein